MLKSVWKVYTNIIDGVKQYIVGRQMDISQPLHSGNVEYHGGYTTDKAAAEALCITLNSNEN